MEQFAPSFAAPVKVPLTLTARARHRGPPGTERPRTHTSGGFPLSLITRAPARAAAAVVAAAALTLSGAAVVAPTSAQAADGQVCTTGRAPTAATKPWDDFAHSKNPLWKSRLDFLALNADIASLAKKLGPASTEAEVDEVASLANYKLGSWAEIGLALGSEIAIQAGFFELYSALATIDPDSADAAVGPIDDAYEVTVGPALEALFATGSPLSIWGDALQDALTYPLSGPVTLPSPAAASASLATAAQTVDAWHDLGNAKVVWTSGTTCVTTSTLSVPAVSTAFGRARTVTVGATRDGYASRGDYVVLLDGQRIGSATQQSSYVVTLPASLSAGKHVLTVAFAPGDGSPIATRSSTVTVAKAKTTTRLKLSKSKTTAKKGAKATITVAVPGASVQANGTATVKVGKKIVKAKIRNGKGTVALRKLKPGTYKLRAKFNGGASLVASSSSKVRLTVR